MSTKHATVSIWQRSEEGAYAAELNGYHLEVHWHPETPEHPRGFTWSAVGPTGVRVASQESEEEIEVAMGMAEEVAGAAAEPPTEHA